MILNLSNPSFKYFNLFKQNKCHSYGLILKTTNYLNSKITYFVRYCAIVQLSKLDICRESRQIFPNIQHPNLLDIKIKILP